MWKAGVYDINVVRPLLVRDRRVVGYRTERGASVLFCDGMTGEMVQGQFQRMVNLRQRGYFALCRRSDGALICTPLWACFCG